MSMPDKVEREATIDAPVDRVWELVSEPGWWIGDGDRSTQARTQSDDAVVIEDPKYGRYPVRTEAVEPRQRVAFRWSAGFPGENPGAGNSTLVDFRLTASEDGTLLRVTESGFGALAVSEEDREKAVNGNIEGWRQQLDILKAAAEETAS